MSGKEQVADAIEALKSFIETSREHEADKAEAILDIESLGGRIAELEERNARLWEMLDWWGKQHPNTRVSFMEAFTIGTDKLPIIVEKQGGA